MGVEPGKTEKIISILRFQTTKSLNCILIIKVVIILLQKLNGSEWICSVAMPLSERSFEEASIMAEGPHK